MSLNSSTSSQQVPSTPFLVSPASYDSSSRRVPDVGSQESSRQSTPFFALIFRYEGVPSTPAPGSDGRTHPPTPICTPLMLNSVPVTPALESLNDLQTVPSAAKYATVPLCNNLLSSSDLLSQSTDLSEPFDWFDNPSSQQVNGVVSTDNNQPFMNETCTQLLQHVQNNTPLTNLADTTVAQTTRAAQQAERVCIMLNANFSQIIKTTDLFSCDSIFA